MRRSTENFHQLFGLPPRESWNSGVCDYGTHLSPATEIIFVELPNPQAIISLTYLNGQNSQLFGELAINLKEILEIACF